MPMRAAPASSSRPPLVRLISDVSQLEALVPSWQALAAAALEPNPFYEPWALLPALQLLVPSKSWRVLIVEAADPSTPKDARLLGLFPLEVRSTLGPLPITSMSMLEHPHCFLRIPLIRASAASETLTAFFDFLGAGPHGASVLDFDGVTADGPFCHALLAYQGAEPLMSFTSDAYTRALFRRARDAESYLAALPARHLKDLRRRQRRLEEEGKVTVVELSPDEDVAPWLEQFVQLEASGWKGQRGTAFGASPVERQFFEAMARSAHARRRLMMLKLELDGRPIAMNCNLVALPGAFAFKIAHDEAFSRFAPGVLLELHTIHALHRMEGLEWADSCADRDQEMSNRIWPQRRILQSVRIAATPRVGGLLVSLMPLARWMRRSSESLRATLPPLRRAFPVSPSIEASPEAPGQLEERN